MIEKTQTVNFIIMKKSILNLSSFQVLSKDEQKVINGSGACCSYGWCEYLGLPKCHER